MKALIALMMMTGVTQAATIMPVTLWCFTTAEAINILANQHKKKPMAYGKNSEGTLIQLWVAEDGRYTVLASTAQGLSCELSSGAEWSGLVAIPKGDKT